MSRRELLPPPLVGVPFAVSAALDLGLTRDSMRRRELASPFYGVRAPRELLDTTEQRCRSYASRMHPGNAYSHQTAGELWRVPFPLRMVSGGIHVVAQKPRRAPEGVGVLGHRVALDSSEVVMLRGLSVCSAAATWCQLAEVLSVPDLVAAGEWLVTGNPYNRILPMTSIEELWAASSRRAGGWGHPTRMKALALIREGALSRPETLSRLLFDRAGLPEARINEPANDENGSFVALPDLSWPELRVAFEYEGDHHRDVGQFRRDLGRVEKLIDHDWSVTKASADDLYDAPVALVQRVARRLARAGWSGTPRLRQLGSFAR